MQSSHEHDYVFRDRYPERDAVYALFDDRSARARRELGVLADIAYGPHQRETFDLFPGARGAPLVIFVHGGYWQSLSKDRFGFVAAALVRQGFSVALPGYPLAPDVTMNAVIDSVGRSVPAIFETASRIGLAPPFWIASGHSAGGHLAVTLAIGDRDAKALPFAGCVPISGIFDLEPLVETSLNRALRMDVHQAAALSPARMARHCGKLVALVGEAETPGFLAQSQNYSSHWRACGGDALLLRLRQRNHYTVLCDFLEERSEIAGAIVRLGHDHREEGKARDGTQQAALR